MDEVRIVAAPNPFSRDRVVETAPAGATVRECLDRLGLRGELLPFVSAWLDGERVPEEKYDVAAVPPGASLAVAVQPGGNLLGSSIVRMALPLVINLGSALLGSHIGGVGGRLAGAALGIGGTLAVSALLPPPKSPVSLRGYSIEGTQNRLTPYGVIPKVFGRHRLYPPLAAFPYTSSEGGDQYLHAIFLMGHGPLEIEDLRIGTTPLADFRDVQTLIRYGEPRETPLDFDLGTIYEEPVGAKLTQDMHYPPPDAGWVQRTTSRDADAFVVELTFPSGLARLVDNEPKWHAVDVEIQYRPTGGTEWLVWYPVDRADLLNEARDTSRESMYQRLADVIDRIDDALYFLEHVFTPPNWLPTLNVFLHVATRLDAALDLLENLKPTESVEMAGDRAIRQPSPPQPEWGMYVGDLRAKLDALRAQMLAKVNGWEQESLGGRVFARFAQAISWLAEKLNLGLVSMGSGPDWTQSAIWERLASHLGGLGDLIEVLMAIERGGRTRDQQALDISEMPAWQRWILYNHEILPLVTDPLEGAFKIRDASAGTIRRSYHIDPLGWGQFDVRVRRRSKEKQSRGSVVDEMVWSALRSVKNVYPVRQQGVGLVAVRIRATDQLNGMIDQLNAVVQAKLPVWDGQRVGGLVPEYTDRSHWPVKPTRNPAWAFANVLCGAENKRPVPVARLDMTAIKSWADWCEERILTWNPDVDQPRRTFDAVLTSERTVWATLEEVAAAGRASVTVRDGLYTVVRDVAHGAPVQAFTPRNSWGFRGSKLLQDWPTALKVRFLDEDNDWEPREEIVPCPGHRLEGEQLYTTAGDLVVNPTYETIEAFGCTSKRQAYEEGVYHLGQAYLRAELFELRADVEHMVCQAGDLVTVTHDVPMFGLGFGRVVSTEHDGGGLLTAITVDDLFPMEANKDYELRVRLRDGAFAVFTVRNPLEDYHTRLPLKTPTAEPTPPVARGDLAMFGRRDQATVRLIVKEVMPEDDLSARLVLVPEAPGLLTLTDPNLLPDMFDPNISIPPEIQRRAPRAPVIRSIITDERVLMLSAAGTLVSQIRITYTVPAARQNERPASHVDVQYRPHYDENRPGRDTAPPAWKTVGHYAVETQRVDIADVVDEAYYDVRLRSVSREGFASDWTMELGVQVVGKTSPPPDVHSIWFDGEALRWACREPLDHAGYVVRYVAGNRPLWESGHVAHSGLIKQTSIPLSQLPLGTFTFMVKAVDTGGRESVNPASVSRSLLGPTTDFMASWEDYPAHKAFAGSAPRLRTVGLRYLNREGDFDWSADTVDAPTLGAFAWDTLKLRRTGRFWMPSDRPFWYDTLEKTGFPVLFWRHKHERGTLLLSGGRFDIETLYGHWAGTTDQRYPVGWTTTHINAYRDRVFGSGRARLHWLPGREPSSDDAYRVAHRYYRKRSELTYWPAGFDPGNDDPSPLVFPPVDGCTQWPAGVGWAVWSDREPLDPEGYYDFATILEPEKLAKLAPGGTYPLEYDPEWKPILVPGGKECFGLRALIPWADETHTVTVDASGVRTVVSEGLYLALHSATASIVGDLTYPNVRVVAIDAWMLLPGAIPRDAATGRVAVTIRTYDGSGNPCAGKVRVTMRGV